MVTPTRELTQIEAEDVLKKYDPNCCDFGSTMIDTTKAVWGSKFNLVAAEAKLDW